MVQLPLEALRVPTREDKLSGVALDGFLLWELEGITF